MRCVVSAGPTFEPLDDVRRLTNFSSGRLGTELAEFLQANGHETILLRGVQATYSREPSLQALQSFTTTADLQTRLEGLRNSGVQAIFHACAVSDFRFGRVWSRSATGELREIRSGKFSTREGTLLSELLPTPKIISQLRFWYPEALLVGWKFEVEGNRAAVLRQADLQLEECRTDGCVANGPAYGEGFGLVTARGHAHLTDRSRLFDALLELIRNKFE